MDHCEVRNLNRVAMADSETSCAGDMETECVKVQLFRRTIMSVVRGMCKDIDEGVMLECYGNFLGGSATSISKIHSRFINFVETEFKKQIDELICEENINEKFLQLQKLDKEAVEEKAEWLPSRNCLRDVRSHDCQKLMQMKQELESLIEKEETEVEDMKREVKDARKQMMNMQNKVSNVNDISSKLDSCNEEILILKENVVSDMTSLFANDLHPENTDVFSEHSCHD